MKDIVLLKCEFLIASFLFWLSESYFRRLKLIFLLGGIMIIVVLMMHLFIPIEPQQDVSDAWIKISKSIFGVGVITFSMVVIAVLRDDNSLHQYALYRSYWFRDERLELESASCYKRPRIADKSVLDDSEISLKQHARNDMRIAHYRKKEAKYLHLARSLGFVLSDLT